MRKRTGLAMIIWANGSHESKAPHRARRMIHLQDNYYLHADKYQFILKRKGVTGEKSDNAGAEKYDDLGYYATIGQAVHAIGELKLKAAINNPVNTIQDVLRMVAMKVKPLTEPDE